MAYIETPRTDAGNATFMTNNHDLENFMISPIKQKPDDIVSLMRSERGAALKTPRARPPLADRGNMPARKSAEFTPLLQSVTKKNFEKRDRDSGVPETPAFLRNGFQGGNTPALPGVEASAIYGSDFGSSVLGDKNSTPMPQVVSSSEQSTPLAVLPKRDTTGALNEQGNLMTLREQEKIVDKVEKENFGLKLKIHFLEEALRKSGKGYNEDALRENTDLKVDRITMQKELSRAKKTLTQVERDVEAYKSHLEEVQARAQKDRADETIRRELEQVKTSVQEKEEENRELRERLEDADEVSEESRKLKGDIEDLEADIREKDRRIDERDDQVDRLTAKAKEENEELDYLREALHKKDEEIGELHEKVQAAKSHREYAGETIQQEVNDLKQTLQEKDEQLAEVDDLKTALQEKEDDIEELHEMLQNAPQSEALQKLKGDIEDLEADVREKDRWLDERDNEIDRLNARVGQNRVEDEDHQRQIDALEASLAASRSHESDLKARIATLEASLHKAGSDENQFQAQKKSLEASLTALRSQESDFRAQITTLEASLAASRSREEDLQARLDAHEASGAALSSRGNDLQSQIEARKASLSASRTRERDLQSQIVALETSLTASRSRETDLQDRLVAREASTAALLSREKDLQAQNEARKVSLSTSRSREKDFQSQIISLETSLAASRSRENDLQSQIATLEASLPAVSSQAKDLQSQLSAREASLTALTAREQDLRTQLRRVREERKTQTETASALSTELDSLQDRYERAVDNLAHQQRVWEEERKSMLSRVRFANTSMSTVHDDGGKEKVEKAERRHAAELKGLAKQIQWLRAKCVREQGFRAGLVYEKGYLGMQIQMFEACNKLDLQMLRNMGIDPSRRHKSARSFALRDEYSGNLAKEKTQKPKSLRTVAYAIIATARMKRMAGEWAVQRQVREALVRKVEGMGVKKGRKRVSSGR